MNESATSQPTYRKFTALSATGASLSSIGSASIRSANTWASLRSSRIDSRNASSPWNRSDSQSASARNGLESSIDSSKNANPSTGSSSDAGFWLLRIEKNNERADPAKMSYRLVRVISQTRLGGISHKTATATSINSADPSERRETGMTPR